MNIKFCSFTIQIDANSMFQQLKRYIYEIAEEYKNINPTIYKHLSDELNSQLDFIPQRNYPPYAYGEHMTIEFNSIKIMPLSNQCTRVSIRQEEGFNTGIYLELIKRIKEHPFFEREEKLRAIEPGSNATPEDWFQYKINNPNFRVTLEYIAEKLHHSPGYIRQLHANWIRERDSKSK